MPVAFAKHRPKFRIVFLLTFPRSWCSKNGQNDLLILSPSDMISYPCFQLFIVDRVGKVEYLVPFSKSYLTTMTPESVPSILKIQARRASEWFDRALNNLSLFVSESFRRCADKPLACASASYFHKPEAYATAQKKPAEVCTPAGLCVSLKETYCFAFHHQRSAVATFATVATLLMSSLTIVF